MLFKVKNHKHYSIEQLRASALLEAYYIIENYPLKASDLIMDQYIQMHYKKSLKNMCIELLLNLTFYKDASGNLILLFKNSKHDLIARLITYGNGAIPGSNILKVALND